MRPILITYCNLMASGSYYLDWEAGDMRDYPEFRPFYTPKEMLEMGVFEGKYLNSCRDEYPSDWFENARLADVPNPKCNYFGVKSRKPTSWWKERNLIHDQDPRGWFEWYCRFWMGRRTDDDARQVQRWKGMYRHYCQVLYNGKGDRTSRLKQRQTLLQWSWNPFPDCDGIQTTE